MTAFAHVEYPTEHPGVARAENTAAVLRRTVAGLEGARGVAKLVLAAFVAALLVLANQIVNTWAPGQVLATWMMLWVVAFVGIALFRAPARQASIVLRAACARWAEHRRLAFADEQAWLRSVQGLRLRADIGHALERPAVMDIRKYR